MTHRDADRPRTTSSYRRTFLKAAGAASVVGLAGVSPAAGQTTLNVLTWEEFDAQEFRQPIEEKLDVRLDITKSTSSAKMFSSWNAGQYEQYDIAVPNNNYVPKMMDADLLAPVPLDAVGNYRDIYPTFKEFAVSQFSPSDAGDMGGGGNATGNASSGNANANASAGNATGNATGGNAAGGGVSLQGKEVYGVPIRFGWYGYGYDTRNVPDHEPSYKIMFEDDYVDADLGGKIIMYDNHFKTMGATALYLGYQDAFQGQRVTLSEEQIQEVKQTLIDQKPRLQGYIAADPTYIQEFRQGNFWVGHSGRNEIVEMWSQGEDWPEFVAPQEGSLAWFEAAVVSKASDNTETAWQVINEFISPESGAQLGKVGFSPSVNPGTQQHLSEEENQLFGSIAPEKLQSFIPFKAVENEQAWIQAWEEVKTA
jgi:spermidine/putrescine transport system substrate-binding protein